MLKFEDFTKLKIKIGTVIEAEKVANTDKLIRVVVDVGTEKRQIIAGIGKKFDSADLVGKQVPVVLNIEPAIIRGIESQGIFVAIDTGKEPFLLIPETKVPNGSKVR